MQLAETRFFYFVKRLKQKLILLLIYVLAPLILISGTEYAVHADRSAIIKKKRGGDLKPSEAELKYLPDYCKARIRADKHPRSTPEARNWIKRIGEDFIHVHHYCFALNCLNRIKMGKGDRTYLLGIALDNLDYMIDHVSRGFVLLPRIYYYKGTVLSQLGKNQEAMVFFQKAKILSELQAKRRSSSPDSK